MLGGVVTLLAAGNFGEVALGQLETLVTTLASVALAFGYAALVLLAYDHPRGQRILGKLAPLGRMALSNYLAQSVIFGWIFYGYGCGRFGSMSEHAAAMLGVALYAAQAFASTYWLRRFRFGPVEWLWRSATYASWQPFLR